MITLEQAEAIFNAAKRLRDDVKKHKKNAEKVLDYRENTPKRIGAHNANLTWSAMEIDRKEFHLHTVIVQAGVCRAYPDDHYGDALHKPSAFHTYTFKRPHPLKG